MNDLFIRLEQELRAGRDAVLLTVIASSGATPRGAGSRQLVLASGETVGTIGGGIGEYMACKAAETALQDGISRLLEYDLSPNDAADIGAVCGGKLTVFCQLMHPQAAACAGAAAACCRDSRPFRLVYDVTDPDRWGMAVVGEDMRCCGDEVKAAALEALFRREGINAFKPGLQRCGQACIYNEVISPPGRVFVFGGGHVACALVPVLARIGFLCTVVDDRKEFANAIRFPDAEHVVVADLEHLPDFHIGRDDYVCIMTRGHIGDYAVQRQILPLHPYYIGVIGSRGKLAFVREKLLADGFAAHDIDAVHAPIGLPISAAAPEEIAVSIAAELIAVRARKEGREKDTARKWRAADVPHIRIP